MANKKRFTLTEEQDSILSRLYKENRSLFYSLAKKYAHNTEARHDLIQDALVYIAGALNTEYVKRTLDYRSLIYYAFKSIYKDRSVNAKNLNLNYGEITDDAYDDAGTRRPDTYSAPTVDTYEAIDDEENLQTLIDRLAENDIDRKIIKLSIDGWTYAEISRKLGKNIDYRLEKLRKKAIFLKNSHFSETDSNK